MTSRSTALARAEARIRQLCCLGLSGPALAPLLFRELNAAVPFETCVHIWLGPTGPTDAYFNAPEIGRSLQLYRDSYFGGKEAEVWGTVEEAARTEVGPRHVEQVLKVSKAAYHRHPICGEILRPCGGERFVRLMVRDGAAPAGAFSVARNERDRDFDDADLRVLARLEPFIAHALRSREPVATEQTCDADTAMLMADLDGRVRWRSAGAQRLLSLARGSMLEPAQLPEGILRTVHALVGVARGDPDAKVPTWRHCNAWGAFEARAYLLAPQEPAESMVGIEIERRVPASLRLFERVRDSGMPLRQADVCLLLALGRTQEEVGVELGVSRNTVVYHRRQIYNRFDVDSREGLREHLLLQ
jgi:DNA-binding CsgD family transcriptional regulator